jgi:hypothetical protein
MALVAVTVKVYDVPLTRLPTVTLVAGGEPLTEVGGRATPPADGVTV